MKFHFTPAERDIFRAKENLTVSQWSEKYREVVKGPAQGRWSNELTPYLCGPMDAFNAPWIREIYICFAPQTGKTQAAFNAALYAIDQDPGPMMYIMADEKNARRISRRQILPTLRACRRVAAKMSSRKTDTATLAVTFRNGADMMLGWATSPSVMASESVQYFFGDEPGKYPAFSGKEADPFTLARMRTNAFPHTHKIVWFSTPNESGDGFSRELDARPDIKFRFAVPCHLCGKWQFLEFDRIVFPKKERDPRVIIRKKLARYQCEGCGMDWTDADKNAAVRRGEWRPVPAWPWEDADDVPAGWTPPDRPRTVAYHLPGWYSPWVSLSHAAAAFLEGLNDHSKMMAFVTQYKAEPWKATLETKKESEILSRRCEMPPGVVPEPALALTMGIDVQKAGFWFAVRGWAEDFTSWLISYGYVDSWTNLETLLYANYPRPNGSGSLPIWRAAIDTGGGAGEEEWSRTEEIYQWIRNQPPGRVYGIKGASRPQVKRVNPRYIDKMSNGKPIPGGLELRLLDTGQFKDVFHWRLGRSGEDSQRIYLNSETGPDYAAQILAEEKRKDRSGKVAWKQVRRANHLLDCEVYAASCVDPEWHPSFSILAAQMRNSAKTAPPRKPPAVPPTETGTAGRVERRGLW